MPYTPPVGRFGTTDEQHDAYLTGDSAGWSWANYAASYGTTETVAVAALAFVDSQRWERDSRPYLRAHEGYMAGAERFAAEDHDDNETEA